MSKTKKTDNIMSDKDNSDDLPPMDEPEGESSADLDAGAPPAPRAARFGEGGEGKGARKERGVHGARAGFFTRISQFMHDVRSEMRRVSWPSANEVKNVTIITIIAVIFFAVYLFAVDHLWSLVIEQITRLANWVTGA